MGDIVSVTFDGELEVGGRISDIIRYLAPELFSPSGFGLGDSNPRKECDIHSFAMSAYEVCLSCIVHGHN